MREFELGSRFLVTGGAGFIGSGIAGRLLESGYAVCVLDNFSSGKIENLSGYFAHPGFELIEGDITHSDTCAKACRGIDYVIHQAALGSVPLSIGDPAAAMRVNVMGTLHMMQAARDACARAFVYASSSAVYGDSATLPQSEGTEGQPLSPYALSKWTGEQLGAMFYRLYGLNTIGLRYFNVFGKRQDPNSPYSAVIPIFIKELLHGRAPSICGDGTQTRDFIYIDDVVEANIRACRADKAAFGQVYNIGRGEEHSILDLYKMICAHLGIHRGPKFIPDRKGELTRSCADITKAQDTLGFCPAWNVEGALAETVGWYKTHCG